MINKRPLINLLALTLCVASFNSIASKQCRLQARTPLEHSYCEIKASGQGAGLPSLKEFQQNPEKVQRLLLKTPARRAGVKLPAEKSEPSITAPPKDRSATQVTTTASDKTKEIPQPLPSTPTAIPQQPLNACSLNQQTIRCAQQLYLLQPNKPNSTLNQNALSESNQLLLPNRQSAHYQNTTDLFYLSQSYSVYLEKMLSIGLGDSTMSFTRFAALYKDASQNGTDFSSRLAEMFELLKSEKRSKAIKPRYNDNYPESMSSCMRATPAIIVCDNVKQNWVYLLSEQ